MSTTSTNLLPGLWYHIYNRGINGQDVFFEERNYHYFLQLMVRFLDHQADIFTYCLLKNHFHFLVRIGETGHESKHLPFSHLFNTYTQAVNRAYNRTGALFERPFKRKLILGDAYFYRLICYIHLNPNHHGVGEFETYPWSSFRSILGNAPSRIAREEVLNLFGGLENFLYEHKNYCSSKDLETYCLE